MKNRRIYNIIGIVTNCEIRSHINYFNSECIEGHQSVFPSKLIDRWMWSHEAPEMFIVKGSHDLDEDENWAVYNHLLRIFQNHKMNTEEFEEFMTYLISITGR